MKRLVFTFGLVVWCGMICGLNLSLRPSCEAMRTTPYSFLGTAIDIALPDAQGVVHELASYKGKSCVVCFIKSSLVSERGLLLSYFSRLYPWFQQKGIELCGVTTEPIRNCSGDDALFPFPVLLDYKQIVSKKYCTDVYSSFSSAHTTFILDEQGTIAQVLNMQDDGELVAQLVFYALDLNRGLISQGNGGENFQVGTPTQNEGLCSRIKSCVERSVAPDIELLDSDGQKVRLSDYRGKWCLLACANTIRGAREYERFLYLLNDVYFWLQRQNIVILCASSQSVEELALFQKHSHLHYRLLSDRKHIIPELFQEPWSFYNEFLSYLIDPNGNKVTSFISGSADLHFARLCHYIITRMSESTPFAV